MHDATNIRIALTTCPSLDVARDLARAIVDARLAACVNVVPGLTSIYRWQGEVQESSEVLLMMKTTAEHLPAMMDAVRQLHSYDVPEFLALNVESGNPRYIDWLFTSVGGDAA
jgi:periplasmic divalent cation tolerance protein